METKWLLGVLVWSVVGGCAAPRRELQPSLRVVEAAIQAERPAPAPGSQEPGRARLYRARHGWWLRVEKGEGPWRLTPRAEALVLAGAEEPPAPTWHPSPLPQEEVPAGGTPSEGTQVEPTFDQGSR